MEKEKDAARPRDKVHVTFLGTGDAFGHGGRLQPCIMLDTLSERFLLDCGTTATLAMHRYGVDPNGIDAILLSHLHGDHFGGLPFFILDAQLHSKRKSPLTIAGPTGTRERIKAAMEVMFPGSSSIQQKFQIHVTELAPETLWNHKTMAVHTLEVVHPSGSPALAFRIELKGKVIAYTGDTEWFDGLLPFLKDADLLIAESYFYEKQIKYHLDYRTLIDHMPALNPKKLLITHMSQDMLNHLEEIDQDAAQDGMKIDV